MMKQFLIFTTVCILLFSCQQQPKDQETSIPSEVKEIPVRGAVCFSAVELYALDAGVLDEDIVASALKYHFPDFNLSDKQPDSLEMNLIYYNVPDKPMKPDTHMIRIFGRGLADAGSEKFARPEQSAMILMWSDPEKAIENQQKLTQCVKQLSNEQEMLIADGNSMEYFSPEAWAEQRMAVFADAHPDISRLITVQSYRTGMHCRAVTMGMDKFGLPDVSVNNFTCSSQDAIGSLLNLFAQTLFERQLIRADSSLILDIASIKNDAFKNRMLGSTYENASLKTGVFFAKTEPQEGDGLNLQFELRFENQDFESQQQEQGYVLKTLFGSKDDIAYVKHDDAILAASKAAKAKLPALKTRFEAGLDAGSSLMVKGPFTSDDGGTEWMWIEVTGWTGPEISGILQNEPAHVKGLKAGSQVTINQDDVFDYILYLPDGTSEGNETGKLMLKAG